MTKKKRNHPDLDEVLNRPWCYYCERDFDDLKILINHQKAKHFKCDRCGRRLNTAGGLSVHMSQVHKENLTAVDNALPNRQGLDIEIFGMEGIPEDITQAHNQRVLTNYHQAQADRQTASGNPAAGAAGGSATKKPKVEAASDLKKRLAEHKAAKLAAEQGDGRSSGTSTPQPTVPGQPPASNGFTVSPSYPPYQQSLTAPSATGSYQQPHAYTGAPAAAGPVYNQSPAYPPAASPPQLGYGQPSVSTSYSQHQPYAQPPQPSFQQQPPASYPSQTTFSPPPYQNHSPHPGQPYSQFPGQPAPAPRPYGSISPLPGFPPQHASQVSPPPQPSNFPQPVRTGSVSLPNAPGLPQRPAFGAPPVSGLQFQQMHQGQIPAPQSHTIHTQHQKHDVSSIPPAQPHINGATQTPVTETPNAAAIDDLISSASKQADADVTAARVSTPPIKANGSLGEPAVASAASVPRDGADDKAAKKEKDKPKTTRLVYSDNDTSPEEKMAMLAKYSFTSEQRSIMA